MTSTTHTGQATPEAMLKIYDISQSDLDRVREYGKSIVPRLSEYVTAFYAWLKDQPEFDEFFSDSQLLERVKRLQTEYWTAWFDARVDEAHLERARVIGETHAHIGLPVPAYFAAMNLSLMLFIDKLNDGKLPADQKLLIAQAIAKLIHLDTAFVVDTYSRINEETITEQSRSLMAMSTPVTAIWDRILMLPIVGIIDSKRSQDIMNSMLEKISETRSKVIILDISGVAVVDTAVANHLIKITKATNLMGCECIVSGLSPAIARTIVELGIDVSTVRTTATLRDALSIAFDATGLQLSES
jgi:rsbT co-antagonist protein RsbR